MTWDYGQLWCYCDGVMSEIEDCTYECNVCGRVFKWTGYEWEEVV